MTKLYDATERIRSWNYAKTRPDRIVAALVIALDRAVGYIDDEFAGNSVFLKEARDAIAEPLSFALGDDEPDARTKAEGDAGR